MRILSYDKSKKAIDSNTMNRKPMPNDGVHIAVVLDIPEHRETKRGNFVCDVKLGIVGSDAEITQFIETTSDGEWTGSWKGIGKWNSLCEALGIEEGSYQDQAFIGYPIMIEVGTSGKYKNIKRMWRCSQEERTKAINWLASRGA